MICPGQSWGHHPWRHHVDLALRDMVYSARLRVGLNDLWCLFRLDIFCDSVITERPTGSDSVGITAGVHPQPLSAIFRWGLPWPCLSYSAALHWWAGWAKPHSWASVLAWPCTVLSPCPCMAIPGLCLTLISLSDPEHELIASSTLDPGSCHFWEM